ncbi:hypothetical protein [Actinomycetospora soli]|uniref:hypothetical protein n=1 Tax=Actinomycetospora soli TaxID=2893887 RepID=UPI001E540810|nr:hypothetical protein [Actinomycetospora soli]MCD2187975.1 hypothetical protein [Actinomycetospora soli]
MSANPYEVSWGAPPWVRDRGRQRRPGVLIAAMVVGAALCTVLVGLAVLGGSPTARSIPAEPRPALGIPLTGPVSAVPGAPTPGEVLADLLARSAR